MPSSVKIVDAGLQRFMKTYRTLARNQEVRVGIQGPAAQEKGTRKGSITNVELMTIHEWGAPKAGIPQRSSFRAVADTKERAYRALLLAGLQEAVKKKRDVRGVLFRLGEIYRTDVIEHIKAGIDPPNTAATLARKKGETTPLIDTASMIGSISVYVGPRRIGQKKG